MAIYQTIQLGRLTMREDFAVTESSDGATRKLSLTGRESMGHNGQRTRLQVEQRRDDLLEMSGHLVAVNFVQKPTLNGYYYVESSSGRLEEWDDAWAILNWSADLIRVGVDNEIDLESRLSGSLSRANDFAITGKRYHAPPVNAKMYWSGSTTPIYIDRVGTDGTVRVYRDLAANIHPRWACSSLDYNRGRVRFLDNNGLERVGVSVRSTAISWELSNSLIRIKPGSGGAPLATDTWEGGAWVTRTWDIQIGAGPTSIGSFDSVSVLDNTFEAVTIRLSKDLVPGRLLVDMTLRRGATVVQMYIQHQFSATIKVRRFTTIAGTAATGYIYETTADGNGVRSIVGSAKTFTGDALNTGISKAATTFLDAFIGVSLNATAGNAVADIITQYLGFPSEVVRGVRR
jgi:hypothetical protein